MATHLVDSVQSIQTHPHERMRRRYPYVLVAFSHLPGGQYGDVRFIAKNRNEVEMQLGDEYVVFNRDEIRALITALEAFAPPSQAAESGNADGTTPQETTTF